MTEQTATQQIDIADFRNSFLTLWSEIFGPDETIGEPHFILDQKTSLFDTLADISAAEASIPVSRQSANLAAQVNHTSYYVRALRDGLASNWETKADWDGSWRIGVVDDAEWQALIDQLRVDADWVAQFAKDHTDWTPDYVGGAFALVAHAAYHLGEIRQGIGVIRSGAGGAGS